MLKEKHSVLRGIFSHDTTSKVKASKYNFKAKEMVLDSKKC